MDIDYLRLIAETQSDMRAGTYDFTEGGACSNCGACCSDLLPVSGDEIKRIKRYVQRHGIKGHKKVWPTAYASEDLTCPFRNDEKRVCDIYTVRPAICRDFRCDKPKKEISADVRMYRGAYRLVRMREAIFGKKER